MGTWKKMAEAFGRAVNSPTATARGRNLVYNSKTVKSAPGDVDPWTGKRPSDLPPEQHAFLNGLDEGERINGVATDDLGKGLDDAKRVGEYRDKVEDSYTDRRLEQDASDEWDEAFARRKQGVRDWYGKDYPQDMAEEGAEAFEKQLWELVDDLKAKGVPAQDILNRIKGND